MKTTIDIPDALAADAKELAHEVHVSLRELVVEGLRTELARRRQSSAVDFRFPTYAGDGLAADVAPADAITRAYDLPS